MKKGFTIIELIVVIAIIGVLVLLATPKFLGYTQNAKMTQIKNDIKAYEVAIESELVRDKNFIDSWSIVEQSELDKMNSSGSVIDKKGNVVKDLSGENTLVNRDKVDVKSNLKGEFIWTSKNEVVYYDKNIKGSVEENPGDKIVTIGKEIQTGESTSQEQIVTYKLDGITSVDDIVVNVNNGNYEILEVNGEEVKIKFTGAPVSRSELVGEYKPEEKRDVSFETNYLGERTRIFENQNKVDTKSYNGYTGELTRTYMGPAMKTVSFKDTGTFRENSKCYEFINGKWEICNAYAYSVGYFYQDSTHYFRFDFKKWFDSKIKTSGKIEPFGDWILGGDIIQLNETKIYDGRLLNTNPKEGDTAEYYTYDKEIEWEGIALLGDKYASSSIKYKYEGYVIIPEIDNRENVNYYKYDGKITYKAKQ